MEFLKAVFTPLVFIFGSTMAAHSHEVADCKALKEAMFEAILEIDREGKDAFGNLVLVLAERAGEDDPKSLEKVTRETFNEITMRLLTEMTFAFSEYCSDAFE